jgi:hypothetical protein
MAADHLGVREHNTADELAAVDDRLAQSDQIAAVPLNSSGSAQLDQMAADHLGVREQNTAGELAAVGVREHNMAGELAAVDDRLAQSDQIAAVPLNSSGSAQLDQMAADLLDVREKKQQREQSVAGWLERSKSPQLMGVSNENTARAQAFTLSREVIFKLFARYVPRSSPTCEKTAQQRDQSVAGWLEKLPGGFINSDAARALTLDPCRECLVLLGVMLCACYKTAAVSAVRNIHDVVLERPQSPQLPGGFRCSDTARAQTLDPYRERLVLLGVLLFQVACNTVIST